MNARPQYHRRSQSNGLKPNAAHARPSRPALSSSKRSPSYNHAAVSHPSTALRRQKSGVDVTKQSSSDSEDMAASFLQFCATCERQIVTPDFSMLYCSESCRKRDSITSTPQPAQSPPISPRTHACPDHPPVDILPQLSPTVLRPLSTTFSELNLGRVSSISSMTSSTHENDDSYDEHDYDEQFQPGSLDPHVLDLPGYPTSTTHPPRRPSTKRASTATDVPSLIHSPSSSYGTTASHFHHNTSTRSTANKSIDLVIPITAPPSPTLPSHQDGSLKSQASTLTTLRIAEGNNTTTTNNNNDAKRQSIDRDPRRDSTQCPAGAAMGSLRQLFNHDAIRSSSRKGSRG